MSELKNSEREKAIGEWKKKSILAGKPEPSGLMIMSFAYGFDRGWRAKNRTKREFYAAEKEVEK